MQTGDDHPSQLVESATGRAAAEPGSQQDDEAGKLAARPVEAQREPPRHNGPPPVSREEPNAAPRSAAELACGAQGNAYAPSASQSPSVHSSENPQQDLAHSPGSAAAPASAPSAFPQGPSPPSSSSQAHQARWDHLPSLASLPVPSYPISSARSPALMGYSAMFDDLGPPLAARSAHYPGYGYPSWPPQQPAPVPNTGTTGLAQAGEPSSSHWLNTYDQNNPLGSAEIGRLLANGLGIDHNQLATLPSVKGKERESVGDESGPQGAYDAELAEDDELGEEDDQSDRKPQPQLKRKRTGSSRTPEKDKEKKFCCSTCGRAFKRPFNLKSHEATHLSGEQREKPFPCPHCDKRFARSHDLARHVATRHGGPPPRTRADTTSGARKSSSKRPKKEPPSGAPAPPHVPQPHLPSSPSNPQSYPSLSPVESQPVMSPSPEVDLTPPHLPVPQPNAQEDPQPNAAESDGASPIVGASSHPSPPPPPVDPPRAIDPPLPMSDAMETAQGDQGSSEMMDPNQECFEEYEFVTGPGYGTSLFDY